MSMKQRFEAILEFLSFRLGGFWRSIISTFDDIRGVINSLIVSPLESFRGLRGAPVDDEEEELDGTRFQTKNLLLLPITAPLAVFSLLLKVVISPIEILFDLTQWRLTKVLWALPALMILIACCIGGYFYFYGSSADSPNQTARVANLVDQIRGEIESGDLELAKQNLSQMYSIAPAADGKVLEEFVKAYSDADKVDEAIAYLKELAPGIGATKSGPIEAHRFLATGLAGELPPKRPNHLQALRHHLDRSGDPNRRLDLRVAWAKYYFSSEQFEKAANAYRRLSKNDFRFYVTAATCFRLAGDKVNYQSVMVEAKRAFEAELESDPENLETRMMASRVFFELQDFERAEQILVEGRNRKPSTIYDDALATLCTAKMALERNRPFNEKLDLLKKAIGYSPE
ncbi:MAG: hypothetical protein AAF939_17905, partial [Planctomycetota bacterium]